MICVMVLYERDLTHLGILISKGRLFEIVAGFSCLLSGLSMVVPGLKPKACVLGQSNNSKVPLNTVNVQMLNDKHWGWWGGGGGVSRDGKCLGS